MPSGPLLRYRAANRSGEMSDGARCPRGRGRSRPLEMTIARRSWSRMLHPQAHAKNVPDDFVDLPGTPTPTPPRPPRPPTDRPSPAPPRTRGLATATTRWRRRARPAARARCPPAAPVSAAEWTCPDDTSGACPWARGTLHPARPWYAAGRIALSPLCEGRWRWPGVAHERLVLDNLAAHKR